MPKICAVLAASLTWKRGSAVESTERISSRRPSSGCVLRAAGNDIRKRGVVERADALSRSSGATVSQAYHLMRRLRGLEDYTAHEMYVFRLRCQRRNAEAGSVRAARRAGTHIAAAAASANSTTCAPKT